MPPASPSRASTSWPASDFYVPLEGLTMTPEQKAALVALEEAKRTAAAAEAKESELEDALEAQRAVIGDAKRAVGAAQRHADSFLPAVVIVCRSRWGRDSRIDGVVLRRTDKTITVKRVGVNDKHTTQFRLSKYRPGVWTEYPWPKGYSASTSELEFPGSTAD